MTTDITMCDLETCIHRRGCQRYDQNHKYISQRQAYFMDPLNDCVKSEPYQYQYLIRFRNSNEED